MPTLIRLAPLIFLAACAATPPASQPEEPVQRREMGHGEPLLVDESPQQRAEKRLTPQVRVEPLPAQAMPTLDTVQVGRFLRQVQVVEEDELDDLPQVQGSAERRLLGSSAGDQIYVTGLSQTDVADFAIYRRGQTYHSARGELGVELLLVAEARLLQYGRPSLLQLTHSRDMVRAGDLLLPRPAPLNGDLLPHPAPNGLQGEVMSVLGGLGMISQYDTVSVDLGSEAGLQPGHVLVVEEGQARRGAAGIATRQAGLLLVYRTDALVSHALVMSTQRPLHVGDRVRAP